MTELYELALEQELFNQQCINKFNFTLSSVPSGSLGAYLLCAAMGAIEDDNTPPFDPTTILGKLAVIQSDAVKFIQLVAFNVYDDTDFFTYAFPPNTVGLSDTSACQSPMMAYGFTSDRTNRGIKRSQKRFAGVPEAATGAGGVFETGTQSAMNDLANRLGNPSTATFDGVSSVFNPVVVHKEKYHPVGKTTWAYRYYEDEAVQLSKIASITAFSAKTTVRSQTSRQYNRGN